MLESTDRMIRAVKNCRVCGNSDLKVYLDLGQMPLANNLLDTKEEAQQAKRFPLEVCFCAKCSCSSLSVVVDPELLFSYYTYRSSISPGFVMHCREMAKSVGKYIDLTSSDLVMDIAGNDGTLLGQFKEELSVKVLNVEPAKNISKVAAEKGIETINSFWSSEVAQTVAYRQKPKVITATNVFAHVDDIRSFLAAAKSCISSDGVIIIEFPYLIDFIEKREFDTVYFEHLSYFPVRPIVHLSNSLGLEVCRIEKYAVHGGTVRVFIRPTGAAVVDGTVSLFTDRELQENYDKFEKYKEWSKGVKNLIDEISKNLREIKSKGFRIAGFAASAKGNTLLNACKIGTDVIDYIVDDTPEKIGKFSPGTGIPIVGRMKMHECKPDYLVILAWNVADDIMRSTKEFALGGGKYIMPIPEFRITTNPFVDQSS